MEASGAEFFYTFLLVFCVLNTAASKKLGGNNQWYGLTIGFSIIAGAYGAGAISGGCFNPAVAIGLDVSSFDKGFGWCFLYAVVEMAAAAFAVVMFWQIRPEEKDGSEPPAETALTPKLINEFLGTMMLVLTVGLNVLAGSKAAAFSIAASLMCMIYATGDVSGGHYNPAVTLAIFCSGRNLITVSDAGFYVISQLVGGMVGGVLYTSLHHFAAFPLGAGAGHSWAGVAVAEIIFTFVLTFVVLCVATVRNQPANQFIGLAIGSCVTVGGFAIGKVSGGSLNPAVSTGIALADTFQGGLFYQCLLYAAFEFVGGALAAGVFRVTYPQEYEDNEGSKTV
jgi:aquaporin Z